MILRSCNKKVWPRQASGRKLCLHIGARPGPWREVIMRNLVFRGVSAAVIVALSTPTSLAPALAQNARTAVDGDPTPELCAQFGFAVRGCYEDRYRAYS